MSDGWHPLFVEFVGVPGVGKTTLATALADRLRDAGFEVYQPNNRVDALSPMVRVSMKAAYSGLLCVTNPRFAAKSIGALPWRSLVESSDTRSVSFNWFFVNGVIQRHNRKRGISVIDQGPLQGYWSTALSEHPKVKFRIESLLRERYRTVPTFVVQVVTDRETITDRLASRDSNWSRVKPTVDDGYSLEDAFDVFDELKDLVDDLSSQYSQFEELTVVNERPTDITTNVDEIVSEVNRFLSS
ncbi:AAA family ATPase [Haloprofundus halobius]|uniref:AAA family ATPase n=1 Tax=Haloprofundus halobius TaxID=2876194 RepID=UPI001CCD6B9E|nr:AAA family ATPase [Haloprofundus halobius]